MKFFTKTEQCFHAWLIVVFFFFRTRFFFFSFLRNNLTIFYLKKSSDNSNNNNGDDVAPDTPPCHGRGGWNLDATTHLYKRSCSSVRSLVLCYFRSTKNVVSYVPMMTKFDNRHGPRESLDQF